MSGIIIIPLLLLASITASSVNNISTLNFAIASPNIGSSNSDSEPGSGSSSGSGTSNDGSSSGSGTSNDGSSSGSGTSNDGSKTPTIQYLPKNGNNGNQPPPINPKNEAIYCNDTHCACSGEKDCKALRDSGLCKNKDDIDTQTKLDGCPR